MRLLLDRFPSPIGTILLATEGETLRALDFEDYLPRMQRLLRLHYGACTPQAGAAPTAMRSALGAYFEGELAAIDAIGVRTGGTPFQRAVWAALRPIPPGTTTSYGRLAATLGQASASRAVGLANGANPVAIVVPCHRVVGADRQLTGYGGGLPRKAWLLAHEAKHAMPA